MARKLSIFKKINSNQRLTSIILILIITCDFIGVTWQQIQSESSNVKGEKEIQIELKQGDSYVHHIVKRKSKGRLFGFGKKPKVPKQNNNPYPKQSSYNPSNSQTRSSSNTFPQQPAYNPNYHHSSNPVGPPPAYPGLNTNNKPQYPQSNVPHYGQQANVPRYGQQSNMPHYGQQANVPHYGQQSNMPHYPQQPGYNYGNKPSYGGGNFGGGYGYGPRKSKGLGIGRNIGSAGFGALAGTALGAYGGYKLGRMVGNLGRMGHYGYYNDHGRYMRCEPPKNIKIDPETNVSYIPLDEAYDKRCSYFDQPPPPYIEPSMLRSAAFYLQQNINLHLLTALISIAIILQITNRRIFMSP